MIDLGTVPAGSTLPIPFTTYGADGASITCSGLAVTDVEIYKNGSTTQRASDAGIALLDTDGIDFDGITGLHGFSIDLSDNTDAGFYVVGAWYWVVVSAITVDSKTITFLAAVFRIGPAEVATGYPVVDAGAISGDTTAANNLETACNGGTYNIGGGGVVATLSAAYDAAKTAATQASVDTIKRTAYTSATSAVALAHTTGTGTYRASTIVASGTIPNNGAAVQITGGKAVIDAEVILSAEYDAVIFGGGQGYVKAGAVFRQVALEGASQETSGVLECGLLYCTDVEVFGIEGTGQLTVVADLIVGHSDYGLLDISAAARVTIQCPRIVSASGSLTSFEVAYGAAVTIIGADMQSHAMCSNGTLTLLGCRVRGNVTQSGSGQVLVDDATRIDGSVTGTLTYTSTGAGLTALGDSRLANLDAAVSTRLATSGYSAAPSAAAVRAEIDSASTQLVAIKAKTDNLPASPAAVGSAMTLSTAAQQDIAQAIHGVPVYYVTKAGNDGNDGIAWDTAKLTIQGALTAASNGAALYIGPGTYTESPTATTNYTHAIYGSGRETTRIAGQLSIHGGVLCDLKADSLVSLDGSVACNLHIERCEFADGSTYDAALWWSHMTGMVTLRNVTSHGGIWLEDTGHFVAEHVMVDGVAASQGTGMYGSIHGAGVLRNVAVTLTGTGAETYKGIGLYGSLLLDGVQSHLSACGAASVAMEIGATGVATRAYATNLSVRSPASAKDIVLAGTDTALTLGAGEYDATKFTGAPTYERRTAAIETDTQDLQTQVGTAGAGLTALPAVAAEIDPEDLATAIEAAMGAVVFTAEQLAAAPTGSNLDVTLSRVTVGEAPEVNIVAYQGARFGPYTITVEASQQGDSHTLYAFRPGATAAAWTLTTAGGEISVSGADYKTLTLTDTDAHTGTAETLRYVLRNTTDDTVVCIGTLDIRAAVSA